MISLEKHDLKRMLWNPSDSISFVPCRDRLNFGLLGCVEEKFGKQLMNKPGLLKTSDLLNTAWALIQVCV